MIRADFATPIVEVDIELFDDIPRAALAVRARFCRSRALVCTSRALVPGPRCYLANAREEKEMEEKEGKEGKEGNGGKGGRKETFMENTPLCGDVLWRASRHSKRASSNSLTSRSRWPTAFAVPFSLEINKPDTIRCYDTRRAE